MPIITVTFPSNFRNSPVTFTLSKNQMRINNNVTIIQPDILTTQGIIHIIDGVMSPYDLRGELNYTGPEFSSTSHGNAFVSNHYILALFFTITLLYIPVSF